jgi:hypothetical protein
VRELVQLAIEEHEMFEEHLQGQTRTFAEAGLLTNDEGLVIRLADGSEFQVTVKRR